MGDRRRNMKGGALNPDSVDSTPSAREAAQRITEKYATGHPLEGLAAGQLAEDIATALDAWRPQWRADNPEHVDRWQLEIAKFAEEERVLAALDGKADEWAIEVDLPTIVAAIINHREKVDAMLRESFAEGFYRGATEYPAPSAALKDAFVIDDADVEAAARAIAPAAWGGQDTLAQENRRKASLRHAGAALRSFIDRKLGES